VYRRRAGSCAVVLGGRRHQESGILIWTIPKGHVEAGESSADTALREVREETGLVAAIEHPLGDVSYWYARHQKSGASERVFKRVRFFLMRYLTGRFADRDDEMDAVHWFSFDEAERKATFENERVLVRRARTLLGLA
jgi:8-oxo-dGTP pyrophosphatase MutT (NUDIX family)